MMARERFLLMSSCSGGRGDGGERLKKGESYQVEMERTRCCCCGCSSVAGGTECSPAGGNPAGGGGGGGAEMDRPSEVAAESSLVGVVCRPRVHVGEVRAQNAAAAPLDETLDWIQT